MKKIEYGHHQLSAPKIKGYKLNTQVL